MLSRMKAQVTKKVKKLSKDLILTTTDYFASDGVSVARIDFEVEVKKNRKVVFDLNLAGSNNLELDGSTKDKTRNARRTTLEPYSRQIVGSVRVVDLEKRWHLECQYSWTEKETKTKEISPHIHLTTVDNYLKGHKISSIEYILKVNKNKRVVFDIDFSGSTNVELTTGGLKRRVTVEPFQELEVAFVQVKKKEKSWNIECKYSWSEQNPSQAVTGQPEQKEISPGIRLVTTRTGDDGFKYEVICAKYATVHFTFDLSDSTNMSLVSGGLVKHTVIKPWDKEVVGLVRATDARKSWNVKIKFEWSESDPQESNTEDTSPSQPSSSIRTPTVHKKSLWTPELGATEIQREVEERPDVALVRSTSTPMGPRELVEESKAKEIAPNVFLRLSTTQAPVRVIYTLDVQKNSRVTFHMNFKGSKNLVLAHGGSQTTTVVEPFAPAVVAVLVVQDPKKDYDLSCKYFWEELELLESSFPRRKDLSNHLSPREKPNPYADDFSEADLVASPPHRSRLGEYEEKTARTFTRQTNLPSGQSHRATLSLSEQYHYGSNGSIGENLPPPPPALSIMQANQYNGNTGRRSHALHARTPPPSPPLRRHGGGEGSTAPSRPLCPYRNTAEFLTAIGVPQYIAVFQEQEMSMDLLLEMAADEGQLRESLKELEVNKVGHREKIIAGIRPYCPIAHSHGFEDSEHHRNGEPPHGLFSQLGIAR